MLPDDPETRAALDAAVRLRAAYYVIGLDPDLVDLAFLEMRPGKLAQRFMTREAFETAWREVAASMTKKQAEKEVAVATLKEMILDELPKGADPSRLTPDEARAAEERLEGRIAAEKKIPKTTHQSELLMLKMDLAEARALGAELPSWGKN